LLNQTRIRLDALNYVLALRERWIAIPSSELAGFVSGGRRIHLKGAQGIFKPRELSEPLTILSTLNSAYTDALVEGRCVAYDFVQDEYDNDGLKRCGDAGLPLIFLLQVKGKPGPEYEVFAPVYIVGWSDEMRRFLIDLSGHQLDQGPVRGDSRLQLILPSVRTHSSAEEVREIADGYLVSTVQRRVQRARFRNLVLAAYRERCAVCLLGVRPLLEATRLRQHAGQRDTNDVSEGISLCAIHHRAFSAGVMTFDRSYIVRTHLPAKARRGEGEEQLLLAFDGKALTLPADEKQWPRLGDDG